MKTLSNDLWSTFISRAGWMRLPLLLLILTSLSYAQTKGWDPDWMKNAPTSTAAPSPELLKALEADAASHAATAPTSTNKLGDFVAASSTALAPKSTNVTGSNTAANFSGFLSAPYTAAHVPGDNYGKLAGTVMGDFNQDGHMDVVAFSNSSKMQVMLGDGAGHFTLGFNESTGTTVIKAVAVDVNNDGYPDIVAMRMPIAYMGTVAVFLNQKDGTFAAPQVIKLNASSYHSTNGIYSGMVDFDVYDVDGDGNKDIVMIGYGTMDVLDYTNLIIETIFGSANGDFATRAQVETDGTIADKATIGYGGGMKIRVVDGSPYVWFVEQHTKVLSYDYSTNLYRVPLSPDGTANLSAARIDHIGSMFTFKPSSYFDLKDVNGDGVDDLILNMQNGLLYVGLGNSDGSFGDLKNVLTDPWYAITSAKYEVTDVDGDGCVDLVAAGSSVLQVFPGNCDGSFRAPARSYIEGFGTLSYAGQSIPTIGPMVYDWDGDGNLDVLYPDFHQRTLSLFRGRGDGSFVGAESLFSSQEDLPTNAIIAYTALDLNGDGLTDIIANSPYGLLAGINQGGKFKYLRTNSVANLAAVSDFHADFNKDGKDDFVQVSADNYGYRHIWVSLSNGDGLFMNSEVPVAIAASGGYAPAVGDVNGDGYPDLVFAANNYSTNKFGFYIFLNDGHGNLVPGQFISTGATSSTGYVYALSVADVNGDGRADAIVAYGSYSINTVGVYLSPESGDWSTVVPKTIAGYTYQTWDILAGDLNGDGKMDLVLNDRNYSAPGLYVALGDGQGNFATPTAFITGYTSSALVLDDFNSDGILDIASANYGNSLTDNDDHRMGVILFRGGGDGSFAAPVSFSAYPSSSLLVPIDLTGNGAKSLLVASIYGSIVLENKGGSSISLQASSYTVSQNSSVTLGANITPRIQGQMPTGIVTFYENGAAIGSAVLDEAGWAYLTTGQLQTGSHQYTATYAGDGYYTANSLSNTITVAVSAVAPAFLMSNANAALTVAQGASVTSSLTFTANSTFNGTVSLSCSGLPANASCSFSNATVSLNGGQSASSTVTIRTGGTLTAATQHGTSGLLGGGIFAAALLLPVTLRRRRMAILALLLALCAIVSMVGCGDSGNSSSQKVSAGTYVVTIKATPSDASVAPQSSAIVLTVVK